VQDIEFRPRQLAFPDTVQGWMIDGSPRIGEGSPIHGKAFRLSELLAFGNDTGTPIDHGAENIEGENFNGISGEVAHVVLLFF
jgi:hypothetical protein